MLAAELRALLGDATPPLIALTGYGQEQDQRRATSAGFARYLVKPVAFAALSQAIDELRGAVDQEGTFPSPLPRRSRGFTPPRVASIDRGRSRPLSPAEPGNSPHRVAPRDLGQVQRSARRPLPIMSTSSPSPRRPRLEHAEHRGRPQPLAPLLHEQTPAPAGARPPPASTRWVVLGERGGVAAPHARSCRGQPPAAASSPLPVAVGGRRHRVGAEQEADLRLAPCGSARRRRCAVRRWSSAVPQARDPRPPSPPSRPTAQPKSRNVHSHLAIAAAPRPGSCRGCDPR